MATDARLPLRRDGNYNSGTGTRAIESLLYFTPQNWEIWDMKTIRALRRERGWTQFELALAVGVQPQTIYLWESGRRLPQVPQLRRLGQIFELCSDDIDLEVAPDRRRVPHRARADRRPGEPTPGRDRHGRATTRSTEETVPSHGGS